ncbi:hypothetical protein IE53DRAFT_62325 [Violaceomyces palustris]|uniref:Uncharacterized protein n=1 Tax=Violaceomyces palustris TaxID=1673888 RepID=A0ACD0NZE5_9BASI|nr:hypothetical protein IE53DRAFT_62325 [Violaceomyces palustris]
MLATMRPSHTYQHTSSALSRPASRASQHSNSPAASPTRAKSERISAKSAAGIVSGTAGKRASMQRKLAKQSEDDQLASLSSVPGKQAVAARLAQTPGLITLSKPLSEHGTSPSPLSQQKGKKGKSENKKGGDARGRQQGSSSPLTDGSAVASTPVKGGKAAKKGGKRPVSLLSEELFSRSAPSSSDAVQRPARRNGSPQQSESANEASTPASGLTWQQELLNKSSVTKSSSDLSLMGRKAGNKRSGSNAPTSKLNDGNLAQPPIYKDEDTRALTWQQELLGNKKRSGPQFDVFADAKDVETFGGLEGNSKKDRRRARAGSVGAEQSVNQARAGKGGQKGADVPLFIDDLFNNNVNFSHHRGMSHGAAATVAAPTTPAKGGLHAAAVALAYAGPNFHNSPSPASLPAPKFSNRFSKGLSYEQGAGTSSSDSSSSGSEDEYEAMRSVRGTTAPADVRTPSKPSSAPTFTVEAVRGCPDEPSAEPKPAPMKPGATVESLLARMMGGASLA